MAFQILLYVNFISTNNQKQRWKKQSTHVLKKSISSLHFGLHIFFLQNLTQECDLKY